MSLYDNEENAVVNQTPTPSETPSVLVGEGDATIKELTPNPAKFGFTKQVFIDALSDVATPAFDTLYLVKVKDGGVVVGYTPYRYEGSIKGYQRIYNTNEPNIEAQKGKHEQKAVQVNAPRVLYDKNGLPVVTLDDDGDILTVVNGKWQKQTPTPVSGGTKLYRHDIHIINELDSQIVNFCIMSSKQNAYTLLNIQEGIYVGSDVLAISQELENDTWEFAPNKMFYDVDTLILDVYQDSNNSVSVEFLSTPTITDTVTEL